MQTVQKTGDSPGAVLGSVGTRPSLCNDRPGWSRQFSLEVPQVQFPRFWTRLVAVKGLFAVFSTFFALLVPELSASFRSWGALDDEEFFVIEGSGVALTPGVVLPGVRPRVVHELVACLAQPTHV